jgi:hypothetical protein
VKLELLFEMHADLRPPIPVGPGPFGTRLVFDVTGGNVAGPRLRGRVLPSGGDWLLVRPDGYGLLDVRAGLATEDGAFVYAQYYGVIEMSPQVQAVLAAGGRTEYGDVYFVTQPRFETGDPRYAWLNAVMAVGEGRLLPDAVEYRVYHALPG